MNDSQQLNTPSSSEKCIPSLTLVLIIALSTSYPLSPNIIESAAFQ